MRNLFLFLLISFALKTSAQSNDYLISFQGIGAIKLGMSQADLEKLLNKKFIMKHIKEKDSYWLDTVDAKYKNIDMKLYFERRYSNETNFDMVLLGVRTSSPLCKTPSGIGIGTDKLKIINTYEDYSISIWPEYTDDTYTTKSKNKAVFYVYSNEGENAIVYYLTNKKVTGIEVTYFYGD